MYLNVVDVVAIVVSTVGVEFVVVVVVNVFDVVALLWEWMFVYNFWRRTWSINRYHFKGAVKGKDECISSFVCSGGNPIKLIYLCFPIFDAKLEWL